MRSIISKSDFLKYQECSSFFWFWKNDPEVLADEVEDPFTKRLKDQGYAVEEFARNLFPEGKLVVGKQREAANRTSDLIDEGQKIIFQASFLAEDLFASCDMLRWNELYGGWDIIEVKSSTDKDRKKNEHILDAAFQRMVVEKAGLKVVNAYLLELNKAFYKEGAIDPAALFSYTEITTECVELEDEIIADINAAKNLLAKGAPSECSCKYKGRSRHCRAFRHLYPQVPDYSVYDLRAIGRSTKVLRELVDNDILKIEDIPDSVQLNQSHEKQKWVTQSKKVIFEQEKIRDQLRSLQYPLYFLDYETLACGIPRFDHTYPYQQTVFQYSLHILHAGGRMDHKEFIHRDASTPVHMVAHKLREDIGDEGNVIVWNQAFEGKCNIDLAEVNPTLQPFLLGLNGRIFDLMKIFERMEYLHPDFKGSYSIKNVLPVMCPELDYSDLEISNGAQAVVEYENLIFGNVPEEIKAQKFDALLEYCKLDTWAMVRIFQELKALI
jgi:hypothetical protein